MKNFKKKKIIIISSFYFSKNDYLRFSMLKDYFDITILDCSKIFGTKSKQKKLILENYKIVKSFYDLYKFLKKKKKSIILDFLGLNFNLKTSLIRLYINKYFINFQYISGPKLRSRVKAEKSLDYFKMIKNYSLKKIFSKLVFSKTQFILSSKYRESFFKSISNLKPIYSYSLDYSNFLKNLKKKQFKFKKDYAVFLDENMPSHEGYKNSGIPNPIDEKEYYYLINRFFKKIEKTSQYKIIIALHPKSNVKEISKKYGKFKILQNKTYQLVKGASFVLAHASTSISYAILENKPVLFLTSNKLNRSWISTQMIDTSKLLGSDLINLDNEDQFNSSFKKINTRNYRLYKDNFIKHPKSKNDFANLIFNYSDK